MINQETLKPFEQIYDDSYDYVLKYIICHCSNMEDVKDIIQNVYFEILKRIEQGKEMPNQKAYILGITKNKLKQYYRGKYKEKILCFFSNKEQEEIENDCKAEIDISKEIITKEDIHFVWTFLKKKNVIIAKIFYLYYYEGYNIKEIAKELNQTESNIKNYLYRTLKELNSIMKERDENETE